MKPKYAFVSLLMPATGLFALPSEYFTAYDEPFTPIAIAEAVRTDTPVTLDGQANDAVWATAPSYTLGYATWPTPAGLGWDDPVNGTLAEPDDLNVSYQLAWDDNYLYILVKVTDDVIVIDSTGTSYENDDAVEIYLDGDNSRDKGTAWNVPGYDFVNDRQFKIKSDDSTPVIGGLYDPQENGTTTVPQDVVVERSFVETDTGYNVEMRLNFTGIFRDFFADGSMVQDVAVDAYFGFDLKVSDDDDGGDRDITHGWAADSNNGYADPTLFGTAVLTGGGVAPVVSLWDDVAVMEGTEFKSTGIGYISDTHYPYVYSVKLNSYIYIYDSVSNTREDAYARVMSTGETIWIKDSIGHGYILNSSEWGSF